MNTLKMGVAGMTVLAVVGAVFAEEGGKQSAAARQMSKARDYAAQPDRTAPAGNDKPVADGREAKEGASLPSLDAQVLDKAAKDMNENWKKLDKALDNF